MECPFGPLAPKEALRVEEAMRVDPTPARTPQDILQNAIEI